MDADEPDFSGNRDFMHQSVVRTFVQRRFDKGVDLTFTAPVRVSFRLSPPGRCGKSCPVSPSGSSAGIVLARTMTERKKLRNQVQSFQLIGLVLLGRLVWNFVGERPHDKNWWIANAFFVAVACVGFGIAWEYWQQYREKFPRA